MRKTTDYATFVFDCDGVVLDSNRVKTEAFRLATMPYGGEAARAMVAYHVAHGGVSRYRKFEHFLAEIVDGQDGPGLDELLKRYADAVQDGLLTCAVADQLVELRQSMPSARWLIASGGDQAELRAIFGLRGIAELFDGGIFGSPDAKMAIVEREIANGNIAMPAVFFGDSRYDHEVAVANGLDFVFISGWSEFADYANYASHHKFPIVTSVREIFGR